VTAVVAKVTSAVIGAFCGRGFHVTLMAIWFGSQLVPPQAGTQPEAANSAAKHTLRPVTLLGSRTGNGNAEIGREDFHAVRLTI